MKKILLSLLVVGVVGVTAVKATGAFFTDTKDSTGNQFSAGTLTINVLEQNLDTQFINENLKSNWQPGESVFVNFDVKNTGSIPLQLRGFATGTWGDLTLDSQNKVSVTQVDRWDGSNWVPVISNPVGFFYYTNDGTSSGTYINLNSGDRAQLRLTVKLADDTPDAFQGKVFTSTIHAEAKQIAATWP